MMRKVVIFSFLILLSFNSFGQENKPILVKKGTTLLDYFSPSERYLYPEFKIGKVLFKKNTYTGIKLNYNYLTGEVEFLKNSDTLTISDKEDIKSVIIAEDTLFYKDGYILQIKSGHPKIGLKESVEFKDYVKNNGIGSAGSAGSIASYSSISTSGQVKKLTANEDLIFQRTKVFYISSEKGDFELYSKKNVLKLFPKNKEEIKLFLKSNNTKFDKEEDLLKLAEFLASL
jgi:hypothetical protein